MTIAFFELEGWEEGMLRDAFPDDEIYFSSEVLDPHSLPERRDFEVISIFTGSRVDASVFVRFPRIKLLTTRSTGYDHIDVAEARARGIEVAYVPGYGDNTVAEFAFGLMLALTRRIYAAINRVKEAGTFSVEGLRGIDLKGATLGVVGTGRIGKEAVKIAKGFGMKIVAFDPFPDVAFAKEEGFEYARLETLLEKSDIITLHCPATNDTHHLLNAVTMQHIKRGAYLVNTARGSVVETAALVEALEDGRLAGAALDVLEEEGEVKDEMNFLAKGHPNAEELRTVLLDHVLMKMPNVLITPHNAFNSDEAVRRIMRTTIESIRGYQAGAPAHLVP